MQVSISQLRLLKIVWYMLRILTLAVVFLSCNCGIKNKGNCNFISQFRLFFSHLRVYISQVERIFFFTYHTFYLANLTLYLVRVQLPKTRVNKLLCYIPGFLKALMLSLNEKRAVWTFQIFPFFIQKKVNDRFSLNTYQLWLNHVVISTLAMNVTFLPCFFFFCRTCHFLSDVIV